ncbi:hypothetical protein CVV65_14640 [Kyrpidia spormannii]|uniref:HEAT repeat domain-containing protein n=1 Tax=Kyrpidia spormannii TaxID=2055160 RepID=A0A2K8N9I8_9BACL|nr:hypothetical protein [Kyrpidia spormannii]ATY86011.1 hypothetical protein CVV65_14640 [Kyrpidia spormannii]
MKTITKVLEDNLRLDFHSYTMLARLELTLRMAEIRCLDASDIIPMVVSLWENPEKYMYCKRLIELELSDDEQRELINQFNELEKISNKLGSKQKMKIDRLIIRLSYALRGRVARDFFSKEVFHTRKIRRINAYKRLANLGLAKKLTSQLIKAFIHNKDQEALELIARDSSAIKSVDYKFLIINLDSEYWRMRVIQSILDSTDIDITFLEQYPWELIYSIGRKQSAEYKLLLKKVINDYNNDLRILGIAAWACGRLKLINELNYIKARFLFEIKKNNGS